MKGEIKMRLDEERFYIEKDAVTYNFDKTDVVWLARTEFKKVIEDGFTEEEEDFFIKELESIKMSTR